MRASQEVRWKQHIKENEQRRRRYDEASKRIENEQQTQAQKALDVRRSERQRMDELMRNPTQPPAPPKKLILRKGARAHGSPVCAGIANAPIAAGNPATQSSIVHERQRREWREGLKEYIARQREATRPEGAQDAEQADALSWQELKMAAEAGFEELLREQEEAAAEQALQGIWRRPGMCRPKGGASCGGTSAAAPTELPPPPGNTYHVSPPVCGSPTIAASGGIVAGSSDSSPTAPSKWAARMKHMLDTAPQDTPAQAGVAGGTADADQVSDIAGELDNAARTAEDLSDISVNPSQELVGSTQSQSQQSQPGSSEVAPVPAEWQQAVTANLPPSEADAKDSSCGLPAMASGALSPRPDANARIPSLEHLVPTARSQQDMPAAAQRTVNALRASMEKLHRATEVMHNSMQLTSPRIAVTAVGAGPAAASVLQGGLRSNHKQQPLWVESETDQSQQDEDGESVQQQPAAAFGSLGHTRSPAAAAISIVGKVASAAADPSERSPVGDAPNLPAASNGGDAKVSAIHSPRPAANTSQGPTAPKAVEQLSPRQVPALDTIQQLPSQEMARKQLVQHQQLSLPLQTFSQQQAFNEPQQTSHQQQSLQYAAGLRTSNQFDQVHDPSQADQSTITGQWGLAQKPPLQAWSNGAIAAQQRAIADTTGEVSVAATKCLRLGSQEAGSPAGNPAQRSFTSHALLTASTPTDLSGSAATNPVPHLSAAEPAAGANIVGGPTLDSLLVEVQQLSELRKALKSELAAMGQDHIVAAMGTLHLSADKEQFDLVGHPQQGQKQQQSLQAQSGSQQHQQAPQDQQQHRPVEDALLQDVRSPQDRQQHHEQHFEGVQPPTGTAEDAPAVAGVSADPAVVQSAASLAHTQHPRQPQTAETTDQPVQPAFKDPAVLHCHQNNDWGPFHADIPQLAALGSQAGVQQHQSLHQAQGVLQAHLQQQPLEHQFEDWQQHTQPQQPGQEKLVQAFRPLRAASPPGHVAASARATGNSDLSSSEMDLSFSFGQGDKQQHAVDVQHEAALQVGSQLEHNVEFKLPKQQADLQQLPVQLDISVGDKQGLVWQQRQPVAQPQQWLVQPQQQQQQEESQSLMQQQQHWLASQQGQQARADQPGASTATGVPPPMTMPVMQPVLQWNVMGLHVPVSSAAAYFKGTPASSGHQQLVVPAAPYSASPATTAIVAEQLAPRPAPSVAAARPQPTSQAANLNQQSVPSRWVSDSPNSRKRVAPNLPVSGTLAGPVVGAAAAGAELISPAGSQISAASSGSFLAKLSKQASQGQATSSQAATTRTSDPVSTGAAERPSNQGSYLAAAMAAKQRLEKEQSERQQIEAAAAAARTAAAKRGKQQAQQAAVTTAQKQMVPLAIGSYSQRVAEAAEGRGPQQSSRMPGALQHRQVAQQPSSRPVSSQSSTAVNNCGQPKRERVVPMGMWQPAPTGVASKSPYRTATSGVSRPMTPDRAQTPAACGGVGGPRCDVTLPSSKIPTPPASRIPSAPGTPSGRTVQQVAGLIEADTVGPSTSQQQGGDDLLLNSYDSDFDDLERAPDSTTADCQSGKDTAQVARGTGSRPDDRMLQQAAPSKPHLTTGQKGDASLQHNMLWEAVRAATAAAGNRCGSGRSVLPAAPLEAHPAGWQSTPSVSAPAYPAAMPQLGEAGAMRAAMPAPGATPAPGVRQLAIGAHTEAWQQQQHAAVVLGRPDVGSTREAAGAVAAPNHYARPRPSPVQPDTKQQARATTATPSTGASQTADTGLSVLPAAPTSATRQAAATLKSPKADEDLQQQRLQESLEALDMRLAVIKGKNDTARTQAATGQAQAAYTASRGPAKPTVSAGSGNAASVLAKAALPGPNKAKQQRNNRLTAARSPPRATGGVIANSSATGKQAMHALPPGVVPPLSGNGLWAGHWPIVPGGFIQPPGGQGMSFPVMQRGSSFVPPAGSWVPGMAWQDPQAQDCPHHIHGLGRHAAAALAAAAPAHMQQPGGMPSPYQQAAAVAAVGLPHMSPTSHPNGSHYWQQMQSSAMSQQYWPVMQQPYPQWPPQQHNGMMYPASAGTVGIGAVGRPGSGAVHMHPPMSAPTGSQYMPGSPLLPTLHYHQTVMRNRTSTSNEGSDTGGLGRSLSAGWQQQQLTGRLQGGEANVWPSRGVETMVGMGKQTGAQKRSSSTAQQESGSIRVYKQGLLF